MPDQRQRGEAAANARVPPMEATTWSMKSRGSAAATNMGD
jgi:hypothetical protein